MQQFQQALFDETAVAHRVFGLDEQPDRATPVEGEGEQLAQREDRGGRSGVVPGPEVEFAQLGQRQLADRAAAVGGAVDGAVVHADEFVIAGEADVAFESVGTLGESEFVGAQGVLGPIPRCPAMGDDGGLPGSGDLLGGAGRTVAGHATATHRRSGTVAVSGPANSRGRRDAAQMAKAAETTALMMTIVSALAPDWMEPDCHA